ncbi:hypothetical protein WKT37_004343 [Salmonella enterica]
MQTSLYTYTVHPVPMMFKWLMPIFQEILPLFLLGFSELKNIYDLTIASATPYPMDKKPAEAG